MQVWRTNHGIVQTRTTVKGVPVAVVIERSTYGREAASILGFSRFNNPDYVKDATSFKKAASAIDYTFNWFYADNRDIAYFSSGRLPVRAAGTDTDMPRWSGKQYDSTGWLVRPSTCSRSTRRPATSRAGTTSQRETSPRPTTSGPTDPCTARWRSAGVRRRPSPPARSPARSWPGSSRTRRPRTYGRRSSSRAAQGARRRSQDGRGTQAAVAWLAAGAHRVDYDRTGAYAHQAAIRIFDTWWEDGDKSLAYDFATPSLGADLARALPQPLDDHPRQGQGSSWLGSPWYGYVNKELRQLTGSSVQSPYAYRLCGTLSTCRTTLRASLLSAVQRAQTAQGVTSPSQLTYDKTLDYIRPTSGGVVGVRPIDWQNRPTFQQVVDYRTHRAR